MREKGMEIYKRGHKRKEWRKRGQHEMLNVRLGSLDFDWISLRRDNEIERAREILQERRVGMRASRGEAKVRWGLRDEQDGTW